jgi:hypothetical protein
VQVTCNSCGSGAVGLQVLLAPCYGITRCRSCSQPGPGLQRKVPVSTIICHVHYIYIATSADAAATAVAQHAHRRWPATTCCVGLCPSMLGLFSSKLLQRGCCKRWKAWLRMQLQLGPARENRGCCDWWQAVDCKNIGVFCSTALRASLVGVSICCKAAGLAASPAWAVQQAAAAVLY